MKILALVFPLLIFCSCAQNSGENAPEHSIKSISKHIIHKEYERFIPDEQNALLVLFPCMPCNAENTLEEFNICEVAAQNGISILLMNFNQRLWLTDEEKASLEQIILKAVNENQLDVSNIHIGGFSSGGNVSLWLSNYLKTKDSTIQPKGVFIVDSPIDLLALKDNAVQTIQRNFSELAIAEANWILDMSAKDFGEGDTALVFYEERSPFH